MVIEEKTVKLVSAEGFDNNSVKQLIFSIICCKGCFHALSNLRFSLFKNNNWNSIDDKLKTLKKSAFKKKLKDSLIASYLTS